MTIKLHAGIVDVTLHYTLTPTAESTRVTRVVTLGVPWSLKLLQPLLVRAFRVESGSTLLGLKAYAEKLPWPITEGGALPPRRCVLPSPPTHASAACPP